MKVNIFWINGDERVNAAFARRSRGVDADLSNANDAKDSALCRALLTAEHGTPLEIASIIWDISAPRAIADQLLRYRHTTPNVTSLRVCDPPKPCECEGSERAWYTTCYNEYWRRRNVGYSREEARFCLPLSTPTRFYWSTNLRELQHIFAQRITYNAEPLTRRVAEEMHRRAIAFFPNCFYSVSYQFPALTDETE